MTDDSLLQLYDAHAGKVSDKWELYIREFDRQLTGMRNDPVRLLEIGVQNGGSLEIWSEYFPNAETIVGCDIDHRCKELEFEDPRISIIIGDANSNDVLSRVLQVSPGFDIIIDDGSHTSGDVIRSFSNYFPALADDGVYFVEDLHCSYWQEYGGGLFSPHSSMSFLKGLADILNYRHWGVDKERTDIFKGIRSKFGVELPDHVLEQVRSLEFLDSLCVVRKTTEVNNGLGRRIITGTLAPVESGRLSLPEEQKTELWPQKTNDWSMRDLPPGDELQIRLKELKSQSTLVEDLNQSIQEYEARLATLSRDFADQESLINNLKQRIREYETRVTSLTRDFAGQESLIDNLKQRIQEYEARVINLNRDLTGQEALIEHVKSSFTWKITSPLRNMWNRKSFDRKFYLQQNPDVKQNGIDPFEHYIVHGRREGRQPRPPTAPTGIWHGLDSFHRAASGRGGYFELFRTIITVFKSEGISGLNIRAEMALNQDSLGGYPDWIQKYDTLTEKDRAGIRRQIEQMKGKPLISILMPTYNSNIGWLKEAIHSVQAQLYENWELCIADDASKDPELRRYLERLDQEDSRIKVAFRKNNGHISKASNTALKQCTGEWVALLDHDDRLAEHALYCVAKAIDQDPDLQLIYSDEDKINEAGQRTEPYFKCEWNPELFYSHNMISHLGVYRKDTLELIEGFRQGFEGSQDYDMALRFREEIDEQQIHHIPRVLYHWRVHPESAASGSSAKPYAIIAGEKALQEHFDRCGRSARIEGLPYGYRVRYTLPSPLPLVSLIIPTRNSLNLIKQCVDSILEKTNYENYEILIVDNGSDDPRTLDYLSKLDRGSNIHILRDDRPFNYSMLNNSAVRQAKGDFIGFLNNDIEVISPDWLSEMVSYAAQREIGAVGAKLLYPDESVQHAGVVLGIGGVAAHVFKNRHRKNTGYIGRSILISSFSALTAACLVIRKEVFLQAGGFDEENLAVAFGDVDFCLKVRELGYRNVLNPNALLFHHESATRGADNTPEKKARFDLEVRYMKKRWGNQLLNDPAYSPNLTIDCDDFSLAWPPRVEPLYDQR